MTGSPKVLFPRPRKEGPSRGCGRPVRRHALRVCSRQPGRETVCARRHQRRRRFRGHYPGLWRLQPVRGHPVRRKRAGRRQQGPLHLPEDGALHGNRDDPLRQSGRAGLQHPPHLHFAGRRHLRRRVPPWSQRHGDLPSDRGGPLLPFLVGRACPAPPWPSCLGRLWDRWPNTG